MGNICSSNKASKKRPQEFVFQPSKHINVPADDSKVVMDAVNTFNPDIPAPTFYIIKSVYSERSMFSIDSKLSFGSGEVAPILTLACEECHNDLIAFLLSEMHANPNTYQGGSFGTTALYETICMKGDCLGRVRALVRAGANPNEYCWEGRTAYTKALREIPSGPLIREVLMTLATQDGEKAVTDDLVLNMHVVHEEVWYPKNNSLVSGSSFLLLYHVDPLHHAVAGENVVGALVMLELGVNPKGEVVSKGEDFSRAYGTSLDILKMFTSYDQALYDTIQRVMDDPSAGKRATDIYNSLNVTTTTPPPATT